MAEIFEVDLDLEKIKVDDVWYTAGELARAIKERIDTGDYRVTRFSEALERLRTVVENSVTFRVKLTGEVARDFEKIADNTRSPLNKLLRDALIGWLTSAEASDLLFGAGTPPEVHMLDRRKVAEPEVHLTSSETEDAWLGERSDDSES